MIVFGQLQTVFALAQLTGGPLYGRLGDLMGERTALIVAFTSSLVSYTLMGMATSVQMLFISRLFSVFMHVMQGKTCSSFSLQICEVKMKGNIY
jgi:OCT family organic cation transporter-like MFS transporter 18